MSTYFFKTNIGSTGSVTDIKVHLDRLEQQQEIARWRLHMNSPDHVLEIETHKMSPEQVKHNIREAGFDADFTTPPNGDITR